jgi:voltage-gated sodium channel
MTGSVGDARPAAGAEESALRRLVDARWFRRSIIVLIVASAVLLGLETVRALPPGVLGAIHAINRLILGVFVVEVALRMLAYRSAFFRDGWNLFDLVIVVAAVVPPPGPWQSLRALRILRVLRLVSSVPTLRRVVEGLLSALPGLASIVVLLMLLLYIAAVMATHLYRDVSPAHFDDIGNSLFTLFQIMTLEGWPDIARTVMEQRPWAWIFFTGYILVATFMVLNLFIGVVVSAIQSRIADELAAETAGDESLAREVAALRGEIAGLRDEIAGRRVHPMDPRPRP